MHRLFGPCVVVCLLSTTFACRPNRGRLTNDGIIADVDAGTGGAPADTPDNTAGSPGGAGGTAGASVSVDAGTITGGGDAAAGGANVANGGAGSGGQPSPRFDAGSTSTADVALPAPDTRPKIAITADLATGLVAYLPFDEGSGSSSANRGSNGGAAALMNGVAWSSNVPSNLPGDVGALSFDGVDDAVQLLDPAGAIAETYTYSIWVRPTATIAANIVARTSTLGSHGVWGQQIRLSNNGKFEHHNTNMRNIEGTTVVAAGTWYHVAVTGQNGGTMHLYVNGIEEGAATDVPALEFTDRFVFGVATGQVNTTEAKGYYSGLIDDFAAYTRVLTAAEIKALAAGQPPGTAPGGND